MNIQEKLFEHPGIDVYCDGRWTEKREFREKADAIAFNLATRDIGPGDAVLLNMERSEMQLIALYGILKSGAAAVPVGPDMPKNRIERIRSSCRPKLEISGDTFRSLTGMPEGAEKITVRRATDDSPALILYTSGSTGTPKGVCHTQDSLMYVLSAFPNHLDLTGSNAADVIGLTELNYISSYIFEIGPAFLQKKRMFLLSEKEKNSVAQAAKLIELAKDPSVYMTPSKYRAYRMDERMQKALDCVSVLCLAGEKLDSELAKHILGERKESVTVYDFYGSTECGLIFWKDIRTKTYFDRKDCILVRDGKKAESSETGEICAEAEHRFLKYMDGIPKRTVDINGRSYVCTGDLGSQDADGSITVTGRTDRLVKLHGLRIELEEIEHALRMADGIDEAAVVYEDSAQRIMAFYVSESGCTEKDLRNGLAGDLPYYMIPQRFMQLDTMPLGERGKIDYTALKKMAKDTAGKDSPEVDRHGGYSGKITEKTRVLAEQAANVLGMKEVSPGESLISLGMDSLLGLQLVSLLEKQGYRMKLSDMFLHPVVGELSELLEEDRSLEEEKSAPEVKVFPVTDPFEKFVIAMQFSGNQQQAIWVTDSFFTKKKYSEESWKDRCANVQMRHPALRSMFRMEPKGNITQMICDSPVGGISYYDLTSQGADGEMISEAQMKQICDFEAGMLANTQPGMPVANVTFCYFDLNREYGVIYSRISHVLADGMSLSVLRKELTADAVDAGEDAFFPAYAWKNDPENRKDALSWFGSCVSGCEAAVFPAAPAAFDKPPVPGAPLMPMDPASVHTSCIDFGPAENRGILTPAMYVLYRYGKAAMETLGKDALVFYMTSSGRNIPVRGMNETVSGYANRIPVVIRRGETEEQFLNRVYQAESHFCLNVDEIWAGLGGAVAGAEGINLPVFVSEVFPDLSEGRVTGSLHERVYDDFGFNVYFMILGGRMKLRVCYNSEKLDERVFEQFLEKLKA